MKLTTYGMWETFRKTLLETLSDSLPQSHPEITKEKINNVLLEDVVTKMFQYYQEQEQEASQLEAYKVSLNTVKDTLSDKLDIPSTDEVLSSAVDKFVEDCFSFSRENIDHLKNLKNICVKARNDAIAKLYGNDFEAYYPELYKKINDKDIINAAVIKAAKREIINHPLFQAYDAPSEDNEIRAALIEHIKYMHEIDEQNPDNDEFAQEFFEATGMTMDAWKAKINEEKVGEACESKSSLSGGVFTELCQFN